MSLETATYLDDLVATNPEGSDLKSEGDDHIRLLKDVLQNTFPGVTAAVTFGTGVDLNKDVLAKTADYVVDDADRGKLIVVDATADDVVITLPTAAANAGTRLYVKKTDATANTVTLDGEGSETIDSALTLVIAEQYVVEGVWCDGTEWHRLITIAETSSTGYVSLPDVKAIDQSLVSGASPTFVTANFTDATDKRLMTDAQETVLDSVETNADVTDFDNVQLAGAVMDSEVTNLTDVKTFDPADYAAAFNSTQTIYVAAGGNDSNDGLSPDLPKLTIGGAITAASALTPASDNIIAISSSEAAEFAEDITVPEYVVVDMPNAHLIGGVTSTTPNGGVRFHRITKSTSGNAVFLNSATTGQFWVEVDRIDIDGTANGVVCSQAAALIANVKTLVNAGTNHGVVALTTAPGHIHFEGEDIYLTSTGYGIGNGVTGTVHAHVKHILNNGAGAGTAINADAGTIYVNANHIDVTSAWDIESGATVYLDCDLVEETGSSANAGTLIDWKGKLAGIETAATADQTGAEIDALLDTEIGHANWTLDWTAASANFATSGTAATGVLTVTGTIAATHTGGNGAYAVTLTSSTSSGEFLNCVGSTGNASVQIRQAGAGPGTVEVYAGDAGTAKHVLVGDTSDPYAVLGGYSSDRSGTATLTVVGDLTATGAIQSLANDEYVSTQANNTLSANPLFWSGTEANYALLTPVSGTLYFTTA